MSVYLSNAELLCKHYSSHLSWSPFKTNILMREVLRLLSSMWLSQGSALYSQKRPFGVKLQQVTKQKANLKLVILIFQVEILTAHLNPLPHLDIKTKWMQNSQLCRNQEECWCWLWQASGFAPAASGLSYSPLVWSRRDLDRFAQPRGTFQVGDLDACVTACSWWGWWWGEHLRQLTALVA